MPTAERFEDLDVWQNARKLANLVYDLTDNGALAQGTAADRTKFAGLPCP